MRNEDAPWIGLITQGQIVAGATNQRRPHAPFHPQPVLSRLPPFSPCNPFARAPLPSYTPPRLPMSFSDQCPLSRNGNQLYIQQQSSFILYIWKREGITLALVVSAAPLHLHIIIYASLIIIIIAQSLDSPGLTGSPFFYSVDTQCALYIIKATPIDGRDQLKIVT